MCWFEVALVCLHVLQPVPAITPPLPPPAFVCCLSAQESAPFMRVLGSYPMETDLGGLDSNTPFDSINES